MSLIKDKLLIKSKNVLKLFRVLMLVVLFNCSIYGYAEVWVPIQDNLNTTDPKSLEIITGSILDFSGFSSSAPISERVIVNSSGKLAKVSTPLQPLKFLLLSPGFSMQSGGFPDKSIIDKLVTQYKMHGYNAVRFHFLEYILMYRRQLDFDYDPIQLDRFYYFVSKLKSNGIYLILDGLSAPNGGYGDNALNGYYWDRYIDQKNLKFNIYFDLTAQQHWKDLVNKMYATVNPYTGLTTFQDPVLAGVILVNENNLLNTGFAGSNQLVVKAKFSQWLLNKYGSNSALKKTWGIELSAAENIEIGQINLPSYGTSTDAPSKRMADIQRFFSETEKITSNWMTAYIAGLGYQGSVTAYHFLSNPNSHLSRGQFKWVDMHNYFAQEYYDYTRDSAGEFSIAQNSMIGSNATFGSGADFIRQIAITRHLGKAFTVSEYGHVAWNQYRRETSLAMPAYAAFQSFDGICQHSDSIALTYNPSLGRNNLVLPYSVGTDPISRVTDTLAAILYLRGDVLPARRNIGAKLTSSDVYTKSFFSDAIAPDVTKLALVVGLGLDLEGDMKARVDTGVSTVKYDAQVDVYKPGQLSLFSFSGTQFFNTPPSSISWDAYWVARVQNLRDSQLISATNQTDAANGVYHSDTGELLMNAPQKSMRLISARTEALVFNNLISSNSPVNLSSVSIISADSPALVSVSAMDTVPTTSIANSKRMLIVLATDARNTGMNFANGSNNTSLVNINNKPDFGKLPVLIRAAKVKISIKKANQKTLKVYSVDLTGQRRDLIPIILQSNFKIEFELDISTLSNGATTYFEVTT